MDLTIRPAFLPACRRLLWLSFSTTVTVHGEEVTEISTLLGKSVLPRYGKQATRNAQLVLHTILPNELNSVIVHFNYITTTNQTSHGKSGCCGKVLLFRQNLCMLRVLLAQGKLVLQQVTYFMLYRVTPA